MDGLIVDGRGATMLAGGAVIATPRPTASGPETDERYARAALSRLVEPVDKAMVALVERYGAVTVFADLRSGILQHERARHWRARLERLDVDADLRRLSEVDGRLVCPGDAEWPEAVNDLGPRRPLVLWVRGRQDLTQVLTRAVAVVGSRAATNYGSHVSAELGATLCDRGWTVVSGAAYGIDACAHKGALAAGGPTVAVLACGVDVTYPAGHRALLERIAEEGSIVSELPPRESPMRGRFLVRNRLIAALTKGTVIVEATLRSGALNTASEAIALVRPVLAVPGPVTSAMSLGVHQLVRKGMAELVTNAAEIIEVVGQLGDDLAPEIRGPVHPRDGLAPDVARVLDAIPRRGARDVDTIAIGAGLATDTVLAALGSLSGNGWVERVSGGWRRTQK